MASNCHVWIKMSKRRMLVAITTAANQMIWKMAAPKMASRSGVLLAIVVVGLAVRKVKETEEIRHRW